MSPTPVTPTAISVSAVHINTSQTVIQITQDKLKIELTEHISLCDQRKNWQTPAATLLTLCLTFATTDFKDALGLGKESLKGVFVVALILSVGWLVYTVRQAGKSITINQLIEKIKNTAGP